MDPKWRKIVAHPTPASAAISSTLTEWNPTVAFSSLTAWLETTAAGLLAAGSALFVAGAIANWSQDIADHFAVRSLGWELLAASSAGHLPGMAIVFIGVLAAL